MITTSTAPTRVSFHIFWISLSLGAFLVVTLVLCASWMAREIDSAALNEQKNAIGTYIKDAGQRIQREQRTAADRGDGVFYSTHGRYAWVPDGLAEWMSRQFNHDRVYVYYLDGSVLQASSGGRQSDSEIMPSDREAVMLLSNQVGASLSAPAKEERPSGGCCFGFRRLGDGSLAFISVRPLNAFVGATDFASNPLLLASVVLLNEQAMTPLSKRFGIPGIRTVGALLSNATLALRDEHDRPLAYMLWSPPAPAAQLFQQVALPAIMSFVLVGGCLFILLTWLRRTSIRLEGSQSRASFLSMHDALTGAANRVLFEQRLREALHYQTLSESKVLLISVDLDRFKEVNDTLGHAAGDELLREVGRRLLVELPEEATLARLGGDEFAVVQPGIVSDGHARWICQRLLQALSEPMVLSTGTMSITVSIGFALESPSSTSSGELARRADVALYCSKKEGRNRCTLYEPVMDAERKDRLNLEIELRHALVQEELHIAYQPIFSAKNGEIVGAEALLRWQHPVRGLVSPDLFVGLAEETGIIDELGMWVLRRSCRLAKEIGLPWIAVNASPVQFNRAGFGEQILHALDEIGFEADRLELEITEGVLLQRSAQVHETLSILRDAGVRIAIDDFGAGYASISYLRNHRIDKIKIDRTFIKSVNEDPTLVPIVRAMIDMGEALGLTVTAEGIEDDAQRRTLTEMGCSQLQGFFLSRPVSPDQLIKQLAEPRRLSAANSLAKLSA